MLTTANAPTPLNRVPKVTVDFWLIKLMAVTVGETAADYFAVNLGLGLTATSLIMTAILVVALEDLIILDEWNRRRGCGGLPSHDGKAHEQGDASNHGLSLCAGTGLRGVVSP